MSRLASVAAPRSPLPSSPPRLAQPGNMDAPAGSRIYVPTPPSPKPSRQASAECWNSASTSFRFHVTRTRPSPSPHSHHPHPPARRRRQSLPARIPRRPALQFQLRPHRQARRLRRRLHRQAPGRRHRRPTHRRRLSPVPGLRQRLLLPTAHNSGQGHLYREVARLAHKLPRRHSSVRPWMRASQSHSHNRKGTNGTRNGRVQKAHPAPRLRFNITGELKMSARSRGEDIIDFGMGNPDGATPKHIVDKLIEAAQKPPTHRYSVSRGLPRLRRAICDWYNPLLRLARPRNRSDRHHRLQRGHRPPLPRHPRRSGHRRRPQPQLPHPHLRPRHRRLPIVRAPRARPAKPP